MTERNTVVGVFHDRARAREAINELKRMGFRDDQIGMTAKRSDDETDEMMEGDETYAAEGAAAGLATGAGLGALWGLGIAAGVLPAIGPAIAGGTLAAMLTSAAAGAAAAGLAGTLVGLGIPKDEAEYYQSEFEAGRVIVTVKAEGRTSEAMSVLRRFGGYDMHSQHSQESVLQGHGGSGLGTPGTGRSATTHSAGERTIQVREEELRVRKTPAKAGEVDIHKEVHTEHRTIDVPVQKEEVVIERHPVSGQRSAGTIGSDSEHIRVPVSEEHIEVEKQPVVKEEVTIGKRKTKGTERVQGEVRKEEIKVDKRGDADVRGS